MTLNTKVLSSVLADTSTLPSEIKSLIYNEVCRYLDGGVDATVGTINHRNLQFLKSFKLLKEDTK